MQPAPLNNNPPKLSRLRHYTTTILGYGATFLGCGVYVITGVLFLKGLVNEYNKSLENHNGSSLYQIGTSTIITGITFTLLTWLFKPTNASVQPSTVTQTTNASSAEVEELKTKVKSQGETIEDLVKKAKEQDFIIKSSVQRITNMENGFKAILSVQPEVKKLILALATPKYKNTILNLNKSLDDSLISLRTTGLMARQTSSPSQTPQPTKHIKNRPSFSAAATRRNSIVSEGEDSKFATQLNFDISDNDSRGSSRG